MTLASDATRASMFDVAVVGLGPTGAVAAALLGGKGLKTLACDRSREIYDKPRAFALDHEIMRVFQQIGLADQVLEHTEPFTPSEFHGVDGQLIKRFTTVGPPWPLAFPPSLVFSQPAVERVLRDHVGRLPSVDIALGETLVSLRQEADSATLQLRTADGSERSVRSRYVIGCDGAGSALRSFAGIGLEDLGFDEPWLVVDLLVNERGLKKLPSVSMQYCEPQRPCTYLIGPKNHRRWEIAINPGEDARAAATPEGTWKLLSRWLTPDDAQLWRQASYRFHALVADRWRNGRAFVAGDAAHQQPPFLGQGMCQGIRDVANLAWKLEAVLRGRAEEALLDTYAVERKGHVIELTTRIKAIGRIVAQRDLAMARARDAQLLAECGGIVPSIPRQNLQPALADGLIADARHPAAGTIFPQPWVASDEGMKRLDDVAGTGWRLVLRKGTSVSLRPPLAHGLAMRTVQLGSPEFAETDGVLAAWFAQRDCVAALVRPDHYVYGVATHVDGIEPLLEGALRQLQAEPALVA